MVNINIINRLKDKMDDIAYGFSCIVLGDFNYKERDEWNKKMMEELPKDKYTEIYNEDNIKVIERIGYFPKIREEKEVGIFRIKTDRIYGYDELKEYEIIGTTKDKKQFISVVTDNAFKFSYGSALDCEIKKMKKRMEDE